MYRQYLFKALFSAIIGTIVTFVAVILGIYSPKLVIWILSILLPLSGWIISSKWPDEWWKISCGLVFPFLLYLTWLLVSILQYNSRYEGQFWRSEFFLISIFLYAMPAVLPFFAARVPGRQGDRNAMNFALIFSFFVLMQLIPILFPPFQKDNFSVAYDFPQNPKLSLRAETRCESMIDKDYWNFRNYDRINCSETRIQVLNMADATRLSTNAVWVIDGTEVETAMSPVWADGFIGIDSQRTDWTNWTANRNWLTQLPLTEIFRAKEVYFRWSGATFEFRNQDLQKLADIKNAYRKISDIDYR